MMRTDNVQVIEGKRDDEAPINWNDDSEIERKLNEIGRIMAMTFQPLFNYVEKENRIKKQRRLSKRK